MQFNIWVNNELMKDIEVIMKSEGKKKNAIINEAIADIWVNQIFCVNRKFLVIN